MVFSSIIFLFYFAPIFFLVYYILPSKYKNHWTLLSSLLFFYWGAPIFIALIIFSCALDYFLASLYIKHQFKPFYYLAIVSNVAVLIYFKYSNFFIENLNEIFIINIKWTKVILPLGVSFLIFHKISYIVDVKRSKGELQPTFQNYLLYVILFPQLIAGPILRFKQVSAQITNRISSINSINIYLGLKRFVIGLSKKVLIANVLGEVVDKVFELPSNELSSIAAILGLLAYAFQIYFDFSGYSDMAIGLGKMMGFTFPENFNFPYISKNITEFWRRWHITLSSWMRDYLYIPLGGNQKGENRTYLNLIIVFLISGFWHGASWNFVIWGAYHGLFLVIERLFLLKISKNIPSLISVLYSFIIVSIGWLLFRADSFTEALHYFSAFNNFEVEMSSMDTIFTPKFYTIFSLAILFSFMGYFYENRLNEYHSTFSNSKIKIAVSHLSIIILLALCLGELFSSGFNPFIYFRF